MTDYKAYLWEKHCPPKLVEIPENTGVIARLKEATDKARKRRKKIIGMIKRKP